MYKVILFGLLLIISSTVQTSYANETSVNGKLKDECMYLKKEIEEAIYLVSSTDMNKGKSGQVIEIFKVNSLISAYKELCD